MFGRNLLWLLTLIYLMNECSSSKLRRSLVRRQVDSQPCQTIQGFDCKCLYHRTTCTNDRDLPSPITIVESAKGQYETVEIVLSAQRDIQVTDQTFEPVKDLFKSDANNYEFRIKFEKFTALNLNSPGIFNRVFPETNTRAQKHISLEIYNPDVPQKDNKRLFENLNVKTLELYALYPFHGTFQELFNGANIKYIRLTGGDIRSDFSQPFTGNIARLELAKQATSLSVENFPVYPAHEMIINAYYISDFANEHVPNYNNLVELRVHSTETIPANAFRQYPNIQTLSLTSEKDIDSQALNGLNQLEKLIIKDTNPSQELLNNLPSVKEFETNFDKLDERTQCQFLDKLANGQLAVRAVPNGQHCTCISAYLDTAAGQHPCKPDGCESSSCAAIRNNYDSTTDSFQPPPTIYRADGSDALKPKQDKVYSSVYQVSRQDQDKLSRAIPQQQHQQDHQHDGQHDGHQQQQPDGQVDDGTANTNDDDDQDGTKTDNTDGTNPDDQTNRDNNDGNVNPSNPDDETNREGNDQDGTTSTSSSESNPTTKKGMSWLPIIIIIAAIVGILLLGAVYFFIIRPKQSSAGQNSSANPKDYQPAATSEPTAKA